MHAAAGGAAWRGGGVGQGTSGGMFLGGGGNPTGTAERQGTRPEERTFLVDLVESKRNIFKI